MRYKIYKLVSFKEEDEFINGINFNLTRNQVKRIINFFRDIGKWNEYYYHEIADYTLTSTDLFELLELNCPYWGDDSVLFDFSGWTLPVTDSLIKLMKENDSVLCIQSIHKLTRNKSHFFINKKADFRINNDCLLNEVELKQHRNDNDNFDYDLAHFNYYYDWIDAKKIIITSKDTWEKLESN